MTHMSRTHAVVFVLAWLVGFLFGPYAVVAIAAGLVTLELAVWRADLLQFPRSRRPRRGPVAPAGDVPSYDAVRHAIALGAHSAREFDFGMRRRLQRIAAVRLLEQHGVDLAGDPDRAAALLGPEAWPLLDPRRQESRERGHGGVDRRRLAGVVDRLESL